MSLSRILNDELSTSASPAQSYAGSSSVMLADPPPPRIAPEPTSNAISSSRMPGMYPAHADEPHQPPDYTYHPTTNQEGWCTEPYTREWVRGNVSSLDPGDIPFHMETQEMYPSSTYKEIESEIASRKRRKGINDDADYQPPSLRRYTPRKHPHRSKQYQLLPPEAGATESELKLEESQRMSAEELRLASSDLEDCTEVWIGELSDYVLETKKRQKQVEKWFETSILERNSLKAREQARRYADRIASIPLPLSTPPLYPQSDHDLLSASHQDLSMAEHGDRYGYGRGVGFSGDPEELEEKILGDTGHIHGLRTNKKGLLKRLTHGPASDGGSDFESYSFKRGTINKKRKLGGATVLDIIDDPDHVHPGYGYPGLEQPKGRGRLPLQGDFPHDSISGVPKSSRRRPGPKKKLDFPHLDLGSTHSGDVTPLSRPVSPAGPISVVYELGENIPPLKRAKKIDDATMIKRIKALEEAQRKVWTAIAKRDVAKVYKYHAMGYQARQAQSERLARLISTQARKPYTRTAKGSKDVQAKAKRLMREMLVFWKKNEREERDVRKREQKEAIDRAKIEEEKRESTRQARKLEFLISQTELYSHFVGSKLKTAEVEGEADAVPVPAGLEAGDVDPDSLVDIDFDDEDQTNLRRHAQYNAQEAIALAKKRAEHFDTEAALQRKTNEDLNITKSSALPSEAGTPGPLTGPFDLDSEEFNFQNPTSLPGQLTTKQPRMLMAQLKEYQLKGLNWLATLYEQGINGILADEMGLGKTVQSISLLAYLAETHDIWGPFLVVAPAGTLHNWQQELTRFAPGLKALPYWGNVKDRTTLRKFWSKKEISYHQDAPFHVLITSYQLVIQDQQYFQRVRWQYMILDEAQNIKNSASARWKTLLGFHCRNRLLLTGTPVQNSMQELWALLHFIMPSLFDSHDEFNEWFSKDIENAAENKGSKLNEHQLRRLHMILKPFMLRRVKRHVQNELSDKIEKDIYVDLSTRQRKLYRALLANVSVAELLAQAANIGDADSARSLMNLVMQFRKVCNHPELFERADVIASFSFSRFGQSGPLSREGDFVSLPYSTRNPIEYPIPVIFYKEGGLLDVPSEDSCGIPPGRCISKRFNIWSTDWIQRSLYDYGSSTFSFLRLLDMSPTEAHHLHLAPLIRRRFLAAEEEANDIERASYWDTFSIAPAASTFRLSDAFRIRSLHVGEDRHEVCSIATTAWTQSCLSRPFMKWFVPSALAPPIAMYCSDRTFLERQAQVLEGPSESLALYGLPPYSLQSEECFKAYQTLFCRLPPVGLIGNSRLDQLPASTMQVPDAKRLIYDSAKLARLDLLLQELKAGDHRILIYFQMTRMMDLMEEYLIHRQYKYLRLDGSSKLEDRRDMVIDWQTRSDIFIFLLSTRAGGLGINLTAADTVIFYDHDWNPSNDAQAMDRAHRLGQTRQVTVYRLITKGTIDERIVQLARVKKDVQDIVVGNKTLTDVAKPSEIVQLLLNDDQLAGLDTATAELSQKKTGKSPAITDRGEGESVRDLWNEEGDDFFGHVVPPGSTGTAAEAVEDPVPGASKGKEKKKTATGASKGSKPGAQQASRRKAAFTPRNDTPDES